MHQLDENYTLKYENSQTNDSKLFSDLFLNKQKIVANNNGKISINRSQIRN